MSKLNLNGEAVHLAEMLNARDNRAILQRKLLESVADSTLLSVTMNIPGSVKTTREMKTIFLKMIEEVEKNLAEAEVVSKTYQDLKTGPECFLLVKKNSIELKKRMIQLEEIHPYGRLMDLDVLYIADEQLHSISRIDLGFEPRSCLICKNNAKICARMARHSIDELIQATYQIIQKGKTI